MDIRTPPPSWNLPRGTETVMIVDDEAMVLHVTSRLLGKLGYTVITAESGRQAIEHYRQQSDTIAAVVVDLLMPDIDGIGVVTELKRVNPAVKTMMATGYCDDPLAQQAVAQWGVVLVQKPHDISVLSRELRTLLDGP